MSDVCNLTCTGRLGKDAEHRMAGSYDLLEWSLAVTTGYGKNETTTWYKCQLWGKRGMSLQQYMTKGSRVCVTGTVSLNKYTTQDGRQFQDLVINVNDVALLGSRQQNSDYGQPHVGEAPAPSVDEADIIF